MNIKTINEILNQEEFSKEDIVTLLKTNELERQQLFARAAEVKTHFVGNKVYYRGLIEFSNICSKNCYYCGIRAGNKNTERYEIDEEDIIKAVQYAHKERFASVVFQSGERTDKAFIDKVDRMIRRSKELTNNEIGITLSLGEQTEETYHRWFESGAHRYLLRIESTNRELFYKIHPENSKHSYDERIEALYALKRVGYQVGTGVMIGLPFQTMEDLADDVLFFKQFDIDMNGMGPYVEHSETPLYEVRDTLMPQIDRFYLALKMIAIVRIVLKDINIAAATALQAIDPMGREKALKVGANVIMPNVTPTIHRKDYQLYENKPCIYEGADDCIGCLEARISMVGDEIGYGEWGDSEHFKERKRKLL